MTETEWPEQDLDDKTRLSERSRGSLGDTVAADDVDDRTRLSERAVLRQSPFAEGPAADDHTDVRYAPLEGSEGRVLGSGVAEVVYNPEIDGVQVTSYTPRDVGDQDVVSDGYGGVSDKTLLDAQAANDELITNTRQSLARRYERGTTVRLWATAAVGGTIAIGSAVAAIILATGF